MKKEIKKNLRNYYFWTSVGAFVLLLANTLGLKVVEEEFNTLLNGFLSLLVMLGVLTKTSPEDADNNNDKSKKEPPSQ